MAKDINNIRTISDYFLNSLKSGELKELVDIVKKSNDLIICFRDGYINIYYKSHSVFRIEEQKSQYKFTFDLGHARYTSDFDSVEAKLKKYGIRTIHSTSLNRKTNKTSHTYKAIFSVEKGANYPFFSDVIKKFKAYIDDFFNEKLNYDFFKGEEISDKSDLLEKKRQQEIFLNHRKINETGESLLFYDMELSIPNQSQAEKKKGSPDCMAIRLCDGIFKEVVLVEVKSNKTACGGSNGIKKHFIDFNAIIENTNDKRNLYNAMQNALFYYKELGIYPPINVPMYDSSVKFTIKYIFTDEAITWIDNKKQKNQNYMYFSKIPNEQIEVLR